MGNNSNKMSLDEVKNVAVHILKDLDGICRKNNLTYFIFYGTLLGAVRHGGFIPWDDDIDIIMPRTDYDRLMSVMRENIGRLRMISPQNTSDTIYPHGKVVDTNTELYLKNFKHVKGYGVGVDVFPFDYMSNDENKRRKDRLRALNLKRLIEHSARTNVSRGNTPFITLQRYCAYIIGRFINTKKVIDKLDGLYAKNDPSNYMGLSFDITVPIDKLFPSQDIKFEGFQVMAPKDLDYCLKACYGDDYMTLPPENERVVKHSYEAYFVSQDRK